MSGIINQIGARSKIVSGNVGISGTPAASSSDANSRTLQLGNNFVIQNVVAGQGMIANNAHYDGAWKQVLDAPAASAIRLYAGNIGFHCAADAGSAGDALGNWDTTDIKMYITQSSGDVEVKTGNLVIGTSGKGIDFSADASPAAGMTAEILDDYEEGTWTPVLGGQGGTSGQSYGNQNGTYTKVGRSVTCCFYVNMTTKGTITGDLHLLGLPFTCGSGKRSVAALGYINKFTLTADHFISTYVEQSTTAIFIQEAEGEGDNVASLSTSNVEDSTELMGSVTYFI